MAEAARATGGEIKATAAEIRDETLALAGPVPALVNVGGDKAKVVLQSPSQDYPAGRVLPAGSYTVSVVFEDGTRGKETRITLDPGETYTLVCSRAKLVCE